MTKANARKLTQQPDLDASDEADKEVFRAMTAEEAQEWRRRNPQVSAQRVIGMQVLAAGIVTVIMFAWWGRAAGMSAAYGALAVLMPAMVLARGLRRQSKVRDPAAVFMSFVVWEAVKVVLTVSLLLAAPKLVPSLNWLALVAGFVVTMKVYLVAAWLQSRRQHPAVIN